MSLISNKRGFTLIEVITAVAVISIGIVGILKLIPNIVSGVTINASRMTAAYLAQEGLEIVRNVRDTNWVEIYKNGSGSWKEGLNGCPTSQGCEVDYYCTTVLDPTTSSPSGHNCFGQYGSGNYLKLDSTNFYSYAAGGSNTKFKRKITIEEKGTYFIVTVYVYWNEKGTSYQFSAQDRLYQW
jgi:prepilin-type N-terminal cleavage/methylation domain-containing protein